MAATSRVEVLFEVPSTVVEGLASGHMIRRGGVVQRTGGAAKGEVVMWLKESGALARSAEQVPARVADQLTSLRAATSLVAVGQVVTLGFSVLSFAVLNQKLDVLRGKVDQVFVEIASLKEELAWFDRRHDVALEARLRGALDQGHWAATHGRIEALVAVRGTLLEAEHHYRGLLAAMLEEHRAYRQPRLYVAYHGYLALAGLTRARCDVVLDGFERGLDSLQSVESALEQVDAAYRAPLRNLGENLHLLRLDPDADSIRPARELMADTRTRIEAYRTEFEFCAREHLSLSEWDTLGGDPDEPCLIFLLPNPAQKEDE